jgi:hypothetical protein
MVTILTRRFISTCVILFLFQGIALSSNNFHQFSYVNTIDASISGYAVNNNSINLWINNKQNIDKYIPPVNQQTNYLVTYMRYDPFVVRVGFTSSIKLTIVTDPGVTSANVVLQSGQQLKMNSTEPQKYEVSLSADQVLSGYQTGYYHNFFGYLDVYTGTSASPERHNLSVNVLDDSIPQINTTPMTSNVIAGPDIVNIYMPSSIPGNFDLPSITKEFYLLFPDHYDFINIVYTDETTNNRSHYVVSNNVQGIGLNIFSQSKYYGSDTKLMGITIFPIDVFFDLSDIGFSHELGHQWINYVYPIGSPHWPISDMAQGVMGMNIPGTNVGGSFPFELIPNGNGNYLLHYVPDLVNTIGFTDLDLYLIGLLPPQNVKGGIVFQNQNQGDQLKDNGVLVGPTFTINTDTFINSYGPRIPTSETSIKKFRVATIIITSQRQLTQDEMSFFNYMAVRGEATKLVKGSIGLWRGNNLPFYLATHCLAQIHTSIFDVPQTSNKVIGLDQFISLFLPLVTNQIGGCNLK